jgi:Uma2 family endonuclease
LPRLVTAEELARMPEDEWRYELLRGRVIRMSPLGFRHGRVVTRLARLLDEYVEIHNLGAS